MGKVVFMFPGQGTQTVGMLKDICETYPAAAEVFHQADALLGKSISRLVFEGPQDTLDLTINTQPAVLTAEVAALRAMQAEGIKPDMMVGFSVGEWSAAVAAGAIDFADALRIVCLRAEAMQQAVPVGEGGMAVIVGKDESFVRALCDKLDGYVAPSNFNYPGQVTVSGAASAIADLQRMGDAGELVVNPLAISIPSHCELMRPAADALRQALETVAFQDPSYPLIMNVSAEPVTDGDVLKENLIRQMVMPVRFEQSVLYMLQNGADMFLEIGPGKTMAGFVRKTARKVGVNVVSNRTDSIEDLQEAIRLYRGHQSDG